MIRSRLPLMIAVGACLLIPLTASAFPGRGFDRGGDHHRPGFLPPPGLLDLSDEQKAATREIFEAARNAAEPKRDQLRGLHEELSTALEAAAPDPTQVGTLVIQLDSLRDELRGIFEQAESSFVALLSDEQKAKYEAFRELRPGPRARLERWRERGPGFDRFGDDDDDL